MRENHPSLKHVHQINSDTLSYHSYVGSETVSLIS
ncbi:hypothetical protein LINPERPRIM_LOCUS38430 [Linum perenne]